MHVYEQEAHSFTSFQPFIQVQHPRKGKGYTGDPAAFVFLKKKNYYRELYSYLNF